MLKLRDFKDRGYSVTKCSDTSQFEAETYKWLIQKPTYERSDNHWGKKYFINVYVCDVRLWDIYDRMKYKPQTRRTLTIKLQFNRGDLTFWINISKHKEFQSIEDIELICEEVWQQLDCDYYD